MTQRDTRHAILLMLATMACSAPASAIQAAQSCNRTEVRRAIEELLKVSTPDAVYVEDGASDGTLLHQGPGGKPLPLVERIIACPNEAGPELIACLDDDRLTRIQCRTRRTSYKPQDVPLGYLCLDLLLALTVSNPIVTIDECGDDGFGACIRADYYFQPDEHERASLVKAAWTKLLKSGDVTFRYPAWLEF